MKKKLIAVLAVVLIVAMSVTGTMAYLTDKTDEVVNTFTVGNVDIELTETEEVYKMVPGTNIHKDPVVTVKSGSEACWLFVKVEESDNFDDFMTYAIADGWTALAGVDGVFYREVPAAAADDFAVLKDNQVKVLDTVTKAQLDALTENTLPTLTFTAYAVQKAGFGTAAAAWTEATK